MKLYQHGVSADDDFLLSQWWLHMREHDELEKIFGGRADTLSSFYGAFKNAELVIENDGDGITVAVWIEQIGFAQLVQVGLWVREDKRSSLSALKSIVKIYDAIFAQGVEAIVGITRQPELLQEHEKFGYNVSERLPRVWNGKDAWIVTLTKEHWEHNGLHQDKQVTNGSGLSHTDSVA